MTDTRPDALARLEQRLQHSWQRRGTGARMLWPLSQLYRGATALRRKAYQSGRQQPHRLPVPVVVVGNVIAGGAGKTPITLALAQHLRSRGWQPGIVSRGHGRSGSGVLEVRPDGDPEETGDEPLLLRRRAQVPVFVGRLRADAGRALLQAHPQTNLLLCDDGLQHLALARDLEICVFDQRGIGNGWLLPAGPLREPWPRPVDFILLSTDEPARASVPPALQGLALWQIPRGLADHATRADGSRTRLEALKGRPLTAIAGIGRPQAFFRMLRQAGLTLAHTHPRRDHDAYDELRWLAPDATIICTEKDAVKLWRQRPDAWAVPLRVQLPADFLQALEARLPHPGSPAPANHSAP